MKRIVLIIFLPILFMGCKGGDTVNTPQVQKEYDAEEDKSLTIDKGIVEDEDLKQDEENMQILLTMGDAVVKVNMIPSETTSEFILMLPITVNMHDYFSRIKYSYFSEPISTNGPKQIEYEIGDIAYWPEGNELLIYYRHDGKPMRSDIIVMVKIESGIEAISNYSGSLEITFECMAN